jgi:hypothetical protein
LALNDVYATLPEPLDGWSGEPVEAWRVDGWSSVTNALETAGHPYVEWLKSDVDFNTVESQPASWLRFWLHDVQAQAMPRFWLRWAFELLQRFRKVTGGTPCDTQLATYLPQADFVVSADKAFLQILDMCRPTAPCRLPTSVLIPAGETGVEALLSKLSTI